MIDPIERMLVEATCGWRSRPPQVTGHLSTEGDTALATDLTALVPGTAYMTAHIGLLAIDTDGMRRLADEAARLRRLLKDQPTKPASGTADTGKRGHD